MRTGAVSGLVARHLARSDSRVVGLVGIGGQARAQLMALDVALPNLELARVFDDDFANAQSFCKELQAEVSFSLKAVDSLEAIAQDVDILVSTQSGDMPIIRAGAVPKGLLHLQIAGALCEQAAIPQFDKIVTDNWSEIQHRGTPTLARLKTAGLITDADIYADIGDVVAGKKPGRESDTERIYFGQVGMGIEDIAVANRIWRKAEEADIGELINLWETPAFV